MPENDHQAPRRSLPEDGVFAPHPRAPFVELGLASCFSFLRGASDAVDLTLEAWALGEDEPVEAMVRIRAPQAAIAARLVGASATEAWDDDGSVVLTLPVRSRDGFRTFVLSFLDAAEVLSPDELRDDIVRWLEATAAGGD